MSWRMRKLLVGVDVFVSWSWHRQMAARVGSAGVVCVVVQAVRKKVILT